MLNSVIHFMSYVDERLHAGYAGAGMFMYSQSSYVDILTPKVMV